MKENIDKTTAYLEEVLRDPYTTRDLAKLKEHVRALGAIADGGAHADLGLAVARILLARMQTELSAHRVFAGIYVAKN